MKMFSTKRHLYFKYADVETVYLVGSDDEVKYYCEVKHMDAKQEISYGTFVNLTQNYEHHILPSTLRDEGVAWVEGGEMHTLPIIGWLITGLDTTPIPITTAGCMTWTDEYVIVDGKTKMVHYPGDVELISFEDWEQHCGISKGNHPQNEAFNDHDADSAGSLN